MTQSNSSQDQGNNTYILDVESSLEMARLLDQDKVITEGMGGIFPEREDEDLTGISRILDVACGPGGWVHEVAHTYPHIEVVGIDISKNTINYARAHAHVRKLNNAHFQVMDALKPLDFPDGSFDMVNMRTVAGFVLPHLWPQFLAECKRVLRPGGILRTTESEFGGTNALAYGTLLNMFSQALQRLGRSFSPTGHYIGILPELRTLLQNAGLQNIQSKAHVIDFSFGMKAHEGMYQDIRLLFQLSQPLLLKTKVTTPEEFATLYDQAIEELQSDNFHGLMFLLTIWGEKA